MTMDSGGFQLQEKVVETQKEAFVTSGGCQLDEKAVQVQKEAAVDSGGCQLDEKTLRIQKEVAVNSGGCQLDEKTVEVQKEVVVNPECYQLDEKTTENQQEVAAYSTDQTEENSWNCKLGFTKKLASGEKNARNKAIALLKSWLTARKDVTEEDLKKIWKGLFYCMWHADKKPVQADLIEKFASLLDNLNLKLSRRYFKVFLSTMKQEWSGIPYLQLDKCYLLLKQFLRHVFIVLNNNDWDSELTKGFMEDLTEQTFLGDNEYPAQGINFHITDVYLSELQDFLPLQLETFALLIEPFYSVLARASDKPLLKRVKDNVFNCLLENSRNFINVKLEGKDADDRMENLGSIVLTMGITNRLFKLATFSSTLPANRKVLYELYEEFSQLDNLLTGSGLSIYIPRAKKPKFDDNLSLDMSSEVSDLASRELVDSVIDCQVQQVNATENVEGGSQNRRKKLGKKCRPGQAKKGANGIDGSPTEKSKPEESSELCQNMLQCKELNNGVDETVLNSADFVPDGGSLVKKGEIMDFRSRDETLELDDSLISNLEPQFEKIAAGIDDDCSSPLPSLVLSISPLSGGSQKRKRVISSGKGITASSSSLGSQEKEGSAGSSVLFSRVNSETKIIGQKCVKKVRFQLKNNLIWKPYNPLPPESLRVPPSATPRGSALKKGVPPGPVCIIKDSPSPKRIVSRKRCTVVRKSPRTSKSTSPRTKLLRKQR